MKPAPGVYPRAQPRSTKSHAEIAVYEALKMHLPAGWYAWHSLRIMYDNGMFGEGDFVIVKPERGLLVLEVKGGNVEQRDGRWFQNGSPMKPDPRAQANEFVRKLISRLERERCAPPAYGVATCFPDVSFDTAPGADDLAQTTIGRRDLPWLDERLKSLLDYALPESRRPRGPWIERLYEMWGDTWIPALSLGNRGRMEDSERAPLDEQQIRTLQMVERNANLLVEGGAGTGKTLLAREAACRFAAKGERVLLLCFTNGLAEWLRRTITTAEIQVWPLGQLALQFLRWTGTTVKEPVDKPGWDRLVLGVAADVMPKIAREWDTVILDEAQDLSEIDWELVLEIARGKRLWVFHDPLQHFWPDRQLPSQLASFFHLQLPAGHRCPPAIMALANCYKDHPGLAQSAAVVSKALASNTISVVQCPSESSVPGRIANEIGKLRSAGFRQADIAIISVRGQTRARTFGLERIGAYHLVKADDPLAENEIIYDTFLRFKGLERPAIIVTDLNLISDRREVRMYIAVTRALTALRIVATREAILADPVLAPLCG
jgi:hypothetical protein